MDKQLDEVCKNYDYGFDLNFVSAEEWKGDKGHYMRQVYLEYTEKLCTPFAAQFHVFTDEKGKPNKIVVEMH